MIVPMYKYAFLVYHSAYKDFLKDIRKIGVVHISTKTNEPTPEMQELFRHLNEVDKAAKKLDMLEPEKAETKPEFKTGEEVFNRLKSMEKEMEHNHHQVLQLEKEKNNCSPGAISIGKKYAIWKNRGTHPVYVLPNSKIRTCLGRRVLYQSNWRPGWLPLFCKN
jgi:V/A-type H+/Na+-transporting ATPase subunit I